VSPGARCCRAHLYEDQLSYEAINQIKPYTTEFLSFNSNEIQRIFTDFRTLLLHQQALDFDNNASLDDDAYYNMTGLRKGTISDKIYFSLLEISY